MDGPACDFFLLGLIWDVVGCVCSGDEHTYVCMNTYAHTRNGTCVRSTFSREYVVREHSGRMVRWSTPTHECFLQWMENVWSVE